MDVPLGSKRVLPDGFSGPLFKITKMENSLFEFPDEPTLFPDDMVVASHPLAKTASFIPFRNAGDGKVLINKKLLDKLFDQKDCNEKILVGISIDAPDFSDEDKCPFDGWERKLQDHWESEIGSFLEALRKIGERTHKVVNPNWYKNLNWKDLKTICMTSVIVHTTYISECSDSEYEWHAESVSREFKIEVIAPVGETLLLSDLNLSRKFHIQEHKPDTTIWIIDSELDYHQLGDTEKGKLSPLHYECSSDSDFESESFSKDADQALKRDVTLKHGTAMCKIVSMVSSINTVIHFVKCPKLGRTEKHILRCLQYIADKSRVTTTKFNIVLMTLGTKNFRFDVSAAVYSEHDKLHNKGFLFSCSAGNIPVQQHQTPTHNLSFFVDCPCCVVVGSFAIDSEKRYVLTQSYVSAGCCMNDAKVNGKFEQGVTTWAIGESIVVPGFPNEVLRGTSVSAAVIAGTSTYILPKLLTLTEEMKTKFTFAKNLKRVYSSNTKDFLEKCSESFLCPKHEKLRDLIFNAERCMETLKYERIGEEEMELFRCHFIYVVGTMPRGSNYRPKSNKSEANLNKETWKSEGYL